MPHAVIRLLPFFPLVAVYVVGCNAGRSLRYGLGLQAFCKTCPIWYLVFFVTNMLQQTPPQVGNYFDDFRFWIAVGLLLSSLGDMCLVWRDTLFIPGILFFAVAHTSYIVSFNVRGTSHHGSIPLVETFIPIAMFCLMYILPGIDSWLMTILVLLYSLVLLWMVYLSVRRYEHIKTPATLCGMVGGSCFIVSDFLLGVEKWRCCLPVSDEIVMVTYYTAQLGLACSATEIYTWWRISPPEYEAADVAILGDNITYSDSWYFSAFLLAVFNTHGDHFNTTVTVKMEIPVNTEQKKSKRRRR